MSDSELDRVVDGFQRAATDWKAIVIDAAQRCESAMRCKAFACQDCAASINFAGKSLRRLLASLPSEGRVVVHKSTCTRFGPMVDCNGPAKCDCGAIPSEGQPPARVPDYSVKKWECLHPVNERRGGNDYIECRLCGLEWDYRKNPDPPDDSIRHALEACIRVFQLMDLETDY
jgi:hypothetical protein